MAGQRREFGGWGDGWMNEWERMTVGGLLDSNVKDFVIHLLLSSKLSLGL
jgi:hypothetical protein